MKVIIVFVLLLSLRTISLAADVTVYEHSDYYFAEPQKLEPVAGSQFPWKFVIPYVRSNVFNMDLFITNKSASVTAINVTYQLDDRTFKMQKYTQDLGQRKGEEYYNFYFDIFLKFNEIKIKINVYKSNILCSSVLVAKGRDVATIMNKTIKKEFQYYDICFRKYKHCVLLVDLENQCDETAVQASHNVVLLYVIPSVIGMGVIISVINLIRVKKYCHRNSDPVETIELNASSTANEVVYADLGFVHEGSQPPRRDEESPYARIIGVLKPVDGNANNK